MAFLSSSYHFYFYGFRYTPAERPDLAALQTIETDDICLLMRKPDQRIEAELAAVPPLAVLCSLKDIVPKNAVSKSSSNYWIMIYFFFFLRFTLKNFSER